MKTFLLIDAFAFIYRAYYAFNGMNMRNSEGFNTATIYGFILFVDELIRRFEPTHVAVAFESESPTFRKEAFPEYKAQRPPAPQEIIDSIKPIEDILNARFIQIVKVEGYEADDIIGTLAKQAQEQGFKAMMATPDKDYVQLVTDNCYIIRPHVRGGYEVYTPETIRKRYQLEPQQTRDLLALMGDKADNISGCMGIGQKNATTLLQKYQNLENIIEAVKKEDCKMSNYIKTIISEQEEQTKFSQYLVTIKTDVPITFQDEKYKIQNPDIQQLTKLYKHYNFNEFLRKLAKKEEKQLALWD